MREEGVRRRRAAEVYAYDSDGEGGGSGSEGRGGDVDAASNDSEEKTEEPRKRRKRTKKKKGGEGDGCEDAGDTAMVVASVLFAATMYFTLSSAVSLVVREPYMDEVFHVRQTKEYCRNRFHVWDDKITTLPGLYIYAMALARGLSALLGLEPDALCITAFFRTANAFFGVGTAAVLYLYVRRLHADRPPVWRALKTAELFLFPVLFFFNFLFYTDAGSTFFVLSALLAADCGLHASAAWSGMIAVLFRQSNVVWLLFCAATEAVRQHERAPGAAPPAARVGDLPRAAAAAVPATLRRMPALLGAVWPYAFSGLAFGAFVYWNGGIVLGDRSNHVAVAHLPQLLYFALFAALCMGLGAASPALVRARLAEAVAHPLLTAALLAVAAAAVAGFTHVHPFLLADNRHLPFYVRRYLGWAAYAALPLYLYGLAAVRAAFGRRRSWLWMACYWACTAAVLCSSPLVEPRYFIVPFLLASAHNGGASTLALGVNVAAAAAVNAAALYVFLARPFEWGDGSVARFMW